MRTKWFANPFKPEFTPKSSCVFNSMYSFVLVFLYVASTILYYVLNYSSILLYITIFYFPLLYFTFCTNVFLVCFYAPISPDVIPYMCKPTWLLTWVWLYVIFNINIHYFYFLSDTCNTFTLKGSIGRANFTTLSTTAWATRTTVWEQVQIQQFHHIEPWHHQNIQRNKKCLSGSSTTEN